MVFAVNMNRVVVFDVGNVLLRWDPVALVAKLLPEQDAPLLAERLFGGSEWQALDAGTLAFDTAVVQASNDVQLPVAHVERLFEAVGPSLTPIAPLVALADALAEQGRPGYVLSNMPAHVQAVILEEHPVFDAFAGRVFSNEIQAIKPQPEIYRSLFREFQLAPECCLFIDDSNANLATAGELGMRTEHLPAGVTDDEATQLVRRVTAWVNGER